MATEALAAGTADVIVAGGMVFVGTNNEGLRDPKQTGDRAPIGFGMMALSEIVNRIFVLTGTKPGDNF